MANQISKAWMGGRKPCLSCEEIAERDAQIIETLQTLSRVFNGTAGVKNPMVKLALCKEAFEEIVRLVQPEVW